MSNVLELTPQVVELLSHVCNYALKGFGLEAQRFTAPLEMLVSAAKQVSAEENTAPPEEIVE